MCSSLLHFFVRHRIRCLRSPPLSSATMAPSIVVEERRLKKDKKNKNRGEESNKRSKKRNHEPETEVHESHNPMKKKKKMSREVKGHEINEHEPKKEKKNKGPKLKMKKKKNEQKIAKPSDDEENDAGDKTVTDERFAAMRRDPLLRRMRKKENKVVIDSRFEKIFKDQNFAGSAAPVDKRGKPKKDEKGKRFLMQHYLNQERENEERIVKDVEEDSEEEDEVGEKPGLNLLDSDDMSGSDESDSIDDDDNDDDDDDQVVI